jgi:hypothetical protein
VSPKQAGAPANPDRFVSASELGEYAYCRRAWWLRAVRGATTAQQGTRFGAGHDAHAHHGAELRAARFGVLVGRLAAIAALLAALAALLLWWRLGP